VMRECRLAGEFEPSSTAPPERRLCGDSVVRNIVASGRIGPNRTRDLGSIWRPLAYRLLEQPGNI
jgi:hypothetical protein